jgi:hypothetical protein
MKPELNKIRGRAVMMKILFQRPYNVTEEKTKKLVRITFFPLRFETIISEKKSVMLLRSYSALQAECNIIT